MRRTESTRRNAAEETADSGKQLSKWNVTQATPPIPLLGLLLRLLRPAQIPQTLRDRHPGVRSILMIRPNARLP